MRLVAELLPICLGHLDPEFFRGRLDVVECLLSFGIRYILYLVEAGDGVAYVRGVVERLFAFLREGIGGIAHMLPVVGG